MLFLKEYLIVCFVVSGENKPIWMQAEEREENKVRNIINGCVHWQEIIEPLREISNNLTF